MFTKKEYIEKWLKDMDISSYIIRKDSVIDVQQNVKLKGTMEHIPVQFGVIYGNFDCSNLGLLSLVGSPKEVNGNFLCQNNKLITLQGSPEVVGEWFCCSYNKLKNLKYCPSIIYGDFTCSSNNLTYLGAFPSTLSGGFDCSGNELTVLDSIPDKIAGLFDCSNNKLNSFSGFPLEVGSDLYFQLNNINESTLALFKTIVRGDIYSDFAEDTEQFLEKVTINKIIAEKQILLKEASVKNNFSDNKKRI